MFLFTCFQENQFDVVVSTRMLAMGRLLRQARRLDTICRLNGVHKYFGLCVI